MTDIHSAFVRFRHSLLERYRSNVSDLQLLENHFSLRALNEKSHLINAGEFAHDVYYIVEGILRVYYIDHAGNEVNQQFYQAGEIVAPVVSLASEEPCQFYLQALSTCEILTADYRALHEAGKDNVQWLNTENAILTSVYLKTARREAQMLLGGAEQRYRWFLKENPSLAEQLPLYQIASYLGVTPVSLSRLRKKLNL